MSPKLFEDCFILLVIFLKVFFHVGEVVYNKIIIIHFPDNFCEIDQHQYFTVIDKELNQVSKSDLAGP